MGKSYRDNSRNKNKTWRGNDNHYKTTLSNKNRDGYRNQKHSEDDDDEMKEVPENFG